MQLISRDVFTRPPLTFNPLSQLGSWQQPHTAHAGCWPPVSACPGLHCGHRLREVGSSGMALGRKAVGASLDAGLPGEADVVQGKQGFSARGPSLRRAGSSVWAEAAQQSHHVQPRLFPLLPQWPVTNGVNQKRRAASTRAGGTQACFRGSEASGAQPPQSQGLFQGCARGCIARGWCVRPPSLRPVSPLPSTSSSGVERGFPGASELSHLLGEYQS